MAWLRSIDPREATGRLAEVYAAAVARLSPRTLERSMGLYSQVMHGPSRLSRAQRELLAVVVSRANGCHY